MFTVYEKSSEEPVDVYDIRNDKHGYPHFLIYEDGQWKYRSAKHYTPDNTKRYIPVEWVTMHPATFE